MGTPSEPEFLKMLAHGRETAERRAARKTERACAEQEIRVLVVEVAAGVEELPEATQVASDVWIGKAAVVNPFLREERKPLRQGIEPSAGEEMVIAETRLALVHDVAEILSHEFAVV